MSSLKQIKQAQKVAVQQQQLIGELDTLVKDIERSEKTIVDLKSDLEIVNTKHQNRNSTREDIAYLTDLLKCANRKLAWEKQMASLQKRTPELLDSMTKLVNDPGSPLEEQTSSAIITALQRVQSAMQRLQNVKPN